ncbi:hypoxanthine phosphoribosyltransferase [Atrimonas thermophila]|uniref:hypoxanthine phosphoribosyltransferase n=1 Tax=Atrimonas thermophila TaxID=3064161 RepID=UPI00399CE5D2
MMSEQDSFIEKVLIPHEEIQQKVRELGEQITRDYQGKDLRVVGILRGAFIFMADLIRNIKLPLSVDFMSISSYGGNVESSGVVRILKDLDKPITGVDVLIVEDIVDTGLTLKHLLEVLSTRNPASLRVCALLDKKERRLVPDLKIDYVGFEIPNLFVVGYGLDFAEKYRNYPFIFVLRPEYYQPEFTR